MWLQSLTIKNFRRIEHLDVRFNKGLTVIVGENNSGKTSVVDALRLMLYPPRDPEALRLTEDDFRDGNTATPIEFVCRFVDLSEAEEAHFLESLVKVGDGKYEMQMSARVEFKDATGRCTVRMWGGETEGGYLPSNHHDRLGTVYLPPLRDPEKGLRAGQRSQVSRLLTAVATGSDKQDFEKIAAGANDSMRKLEPVLKAEKAVTDNLERMTGPELAPKPALVFADPRFNRLVATLSMEIDSLPLILNGLGYTNLAFASTVVSAFENNPQFALRSMLIEEPEAHLHPQLQGLFLRYLSDLTLDHADGAFQVIVSSHSPLLTSQAPLGAILVLNAAAPGHTAILLGDLKIPSNLGKKLERYLDASRAELFFARRIILVEGIAEALLLPILADALGLSLRKGAVAVLNTGGINFDAFLPLFGKDRLSMPVAILTDGDDKGRTGKASATAQGIVKAAQDKETVSVLLSEVTFEHELARSTELLPALIAAYKVLHPIKGGHLEQQLANLATQEHKADAFLAEFAQPGVRKGEFAQELALILTAQPPSATAVPPYIRAAIEFVLPKPAEAGAQT